MDIYELVKCPGSCARLVQAVNHRIASHYYRPAVPCDGSGQTTRVVWAPYWMRASMRVAVFTAMLGLGSEEFDAWIIPEVYYLDTRKEVHA